MPTDQMAAMQQMMAQMAGGSSSMPSVPSTEHHSAQKDDKDSLHKHWTSVYPIYLDAKRHYRHGCRRVAYDKAVMFPNSLFIANTVKFLRLEFHHEVCSRCDG